MKHKFLKMKQNLDRKFRERDIDDNRLKEKFSLNTISVHTINHTCK